MDLYGSHSYTVGLIVISLNTLGKQNTISQELSVSIKELVQYCNGGKEEQNPSVETKMETEGQNAIVWKCV